MTKKTPHASDLKINKKDLKVMEDALDILIRKDSSARDSENPMSYMRKTNKMIQGYFENKYEAAIAMLEMSLSRGYSVSSDLSAEKACKGGCRGACKISCVTSCNTSCDKTCKGTCKGGCKTGVIWF